MKTPPMKSLAAAVTAALLTAIAVAPLAAEEPAKKEPAAAKQVSIADGKVTFDAPAGLTQKKPQFNLIDAEFSAPAADGGRPGRLTISRAGGSLEQNLGRWKQQIRPAEGAGGGNMKVTVKKINGMEVRLVEANGSYHPPFGARFGFKGYRLVGAIYETEKTGRIFVKFYGPEKTIAKHEKAFNTMVESLKVKE